jgi:hypothetical protein
MPVDIDLHVAPIQGACGKAAGRYSAVPIAWRFSLR